MSERQDCARVRPWLPLVPGGELPRSRDVEVREHLAACTDCRAELGPFLRARRALRTLTPTIASAAENAYFRTLQVDTLVAVRRQALSIRRSRQVQSPARRSFAGVMTAAALFLLGVYLVPQPTGYSDLPSIPTTVPATTVESSETRFRNVGYGLMGHELQLPICPLPLECQAPAGAEEPAPERDARRALRKGRTGVPADGR